MFDRFTETFRLVPRSSQAVFLLLAMGVALALACHTVATYLWRSGADLVRHFTRFYAFRGGGLGSRAPAELGWHLPNLVAAQILLETQKGFPDIRVARKGMLGVIQVDGPKQAELFDPNWQQS